MKKGNDVDDLIGLVELAEDASERVKVLKNIMFNLVMVTFLVTGFTFLFSFITYKTYLVQKVGSSYWFIEFIIGFVLAYVILFSFRPIMKKNREIKVELKVLDKLYNLIDPLKFQVREKLSIMKMAEIEMRLSRIDFGNYQPKEEPNQVEKQLNLEKLKESLSLES